MNMGQLLKLKRDMLGLSARDLSLKAGLSAGYVSKMESGAMIPSLVAFAKIVKVLNCTDMEIKLLLMEACEIKP